LARCLSPKWQKQLAFFDVQRYSAPVENIPGDRDHRSGVCDHLIMIIPELVIIFIPES
jgi:hypothetical protein